MIENLNQIASDIRKWREHHQFYTPKSIATEQERDMMLGKLMLVVTEVTECCQSDSEQNFREEMADIAIRIMDITAACEIDLDGAIRSLHHTVFNADLMDVVNQISHAAEAVRHNNIAGLTTALATAFWYLEMWAQGNFDLLAEIESKMKANWLRPIKHGKLCSL